MTIPEVVLWGGLYALALVAVASFLIPYCWAWGDWLAVDRITSILEKREEDKANETAIKFKPKGKV